MLAVREDHSGGGEPVHTIVGLDLAGPNADGGTVLCAGADFYATPGAVRRRPAGLDRVEPPEHAVGRQHGHGRHARPGRR